MGGGHRGAEPGGDGGRGQEARLEREAAGHQVAAHGELRAQGRRAGAPRAAALPHERAEEEPGADALAEHVRPRRADQTEPGERADPVHEDDAGDRRHSVAREDVAQRSRGVLHAAHPPVARQGHQQQRGADQRHPQPAHRALGDRAAVAERFGDGPDHQLPDDHQASADGEREPRGLHPLGDGVGAPTGAVHAGGAGRRAVGEEVELARDLREQHRGDGEARQRHRPEPSDDGRVDEEVQRLRGEHGQGGPGEPHDLPRRTHAASSPALVSRAAVPNGELAVPTLPAGSASSACCLPPASLNRSASGTRRRTRAACCATRAR